MGKRPRGRPRHPDALTPAEWRVADAVRHGLSRREIARLRGTSVDAVRFHLRSVAAKVGVAGAPGIRFWEGYPVTTPLRAADGAAVIRVAALAQVSLHVRDLDRAVGFYRDMLGLPLVLTAGPMAFLDLAGVRLYLHACADEEWRPGSVLYLLVDDIAAAYAALGERGIDRTGAPHRVHTHPDGTEEWMAFLADPDGNTLAVVSRVPSTLDA